MAASVAFLHQVEYETALNEYEEETKRQFEQHEQDDERANAEDASKRCYTPGEDASAEERQALLRRNLLRGPGGAKLKPKKDTAVATWLSMQEVNVPKRASCPGSRPHPQRNHASLRRSSSMVVRTGLIHKVVHVRGLVDRILPIYNPHNPYRRSWDMLIMSLVVWTAVTVPLSVSFGLPTGTGWEAVNYSITILFVMDLVINFRTAFFNFQGELVRDSSAIAANYFKMWFWIDLFGTIPFDTIVLWTGVLDNVGQNSTELAALGFLKAPRLLRLGRLLLFLDSFKNAKMFRIVQLFLAMILLSHWLACIWYMMYRFGGKDQSEDWAFELAANGGASTAVSYYVITYYYSFLLLVGDNVTPYNNYERTFYVLVLIAGTFFYSAVVGQMATLVATMNVAVNRHGQKLLMVQDALRYAGVPDHHSEKVQKYFEYLQKRSHPGAEGMQFLQDLPTSLHLSLCQFLHIRSLHKVPLFQDCEQGFMNALALRIRMISLSPREVIFRVGDVGKEMYVIKKGCVAVTSPSYTMWGLLQPGEIFGEVALLSTGKRTANCTALGFVDLAVLTGPDLQVVMRDYPVSAAIIHERATARARSLQTKSKMWLDMPMEELSDADEEGTGDDADGDAGSIGSISSTGSREGNITKAVAAGPGSDDESGGAILDADVVKDAVLMTLGTTGPDAGRQDWPELREEESAAARSRSPSPTSRPLPAVSNALRPASAPRDKPMDLSWSTHPKQRSTAPLEEGQEEQPQLEVAGVAAAIGGQQPGQMGAGAASTAAVDMAAPALSTKAAAAAALRSDGAFPVPQRAASSFLARVMSAAPYRPPSAVPSRASGASLQRSSLSLTGRDRVRDRARQSGILSPLGVSSRTPSASARRQTSETASRTSSAAGMWSASGMAARAAAGPLLRSPSSTRSRTAAAAAADPSSARYRTAVMRKSSGSFETEAALGDDLNAAAAAAATMMRPAGADRRQSIAYWAQEEEAMHGAAEPTEFTPVLDGDEIVWKAPRRSTRTSAEVDPDGLMVASRQTSRLWDAVGATSPLTHQHRRRHRARAPPGADAGDGGEVNAGSGLDGEASETPLQQFDSLTPPRSLLDGLARDLDAKHAAQTPARVAGGAGGGSFAATRITPRRDGARPQGGHRYPPGIQSPAPRRLAAAAAVAAALASEPSWDDAASDAAATTTTAAASNAAAAAAPAAPAAESRGPGPLAESIEPGAQTSASGQATGSATSSPPRRRSSAGIASPISTAAAAAVATAVSTGTPFASMGFSRRPTYMKRLSGGLGPPPAAPAAAADSSPNFSSGAGGAHSGSQPALPHFAGASILRLSRRSSGFNLPAVVAAATNSPPPAAAAAGALPARRSSRLSLCVVAAAEPSSMEAVSGDANAGGGAAAPMEAPEWIRTRMPNRRYRRGSVESIHEEELAALAPTSAPCRGQSSGHISPLPVNGRRHRHSHTDGEELGSPVGMAAGAASSLSQRASAQGSPSRNAAPLPAVGSGSHRASRTSFSGAPWPQQQPPPPPPPPDGVFVPRASWDKLLQAVSRLSWFENALQELMALVSEQDKALSRLEERAERAAAMENATGGDPANSVLGIMASSLLAITGRGSNSGNPRNTSAAAGSFVGGNSSGVAGAARGALLATQQQHQQQRTLSTGGASSAALARSESNEPLQRSTTSRLRGAVRAVGLTSRQTGLGSARGRLATMQTPGGAPDRGSGDAGDSDSQTQSQSQLQGLGDLDGTGGQVSGAESSSAAASAGGPSNASGTKLSRALSRRGSMVRIGSMDPEVAAMLAAAPRTTASARRTSLIMTAAFDPDEALASAPAAAGAPRAASSARRSSLVMTDPLDPDGTAGGPRTTVSKRRSSLVMQDPLDPDWAGITAAGVSRTPTFQATRRSSLVLPDPVAGAGKAMAPVMPPRAVGSPSARGSSSAQPAPPGLRSALKGGAAASRQASSYELTTRDSTVR